MNAAALDALLTELRAATGQRLPVVERNARGVVVLLDAGPDGTRQVVIGEPAGTPPVIVPPATTWRATVFRDSRGLIDFVDIVPHPP
jgi:hypothetical protein